MNGQIMCTSCQGAGGWGCGEDAEGCASCGGTGEVPLPHATFRGTPVSGEPGVSDKASEACAHRLSALKIVFIHGHGASSESFNYIRSQLDRDAINLEYDGANGFAANLAVMLD